jgi:hypothetical protein
MKKYHYNGETYDRIPDPFIGCSPMYDKNSNPRDDLFVALGGTITEDGEKTPKQRVCEEFADLIEDLASKTDKITPEEFLLAAQNGISSNLIDFARAREVPEAVITEGRVRIVEIMADAMRFGMSWADLIAGITPSASVAADIHS